MKKIKIVNSFEELIAELGIKPGGTVNFMSPQFEREYELEIKFTPQDQNELKALIESCPKDVLQKMGVCIWGRYEESKKEQERTYLKPGEIHYLFPGEWYNYIPNGFPIVSISGRREYFRHGESDDDIRFGCLAYGFIRSF